MPKDSITIGLAGDTMLGRLVNERMAAAGCRHPWGDVLPLLKRTDLNLVNLETTLTTSERAVPKAFNYKADPDKVQALKEARIGVVNLANNHMLDFTEEGLLETLETLDKAGILHAGAGRNIAEAERPVIITRKGIRIGVLGYQDNFPEWEAGDKPGVTYVRVGDVKKVEKAIAALRPEVDILIFSIHWGPNMRQRPTEEFKAFAHRLIELGVDIVHGHSAHIFQGIEVYRDRPILYDTGDFVDDYAVDAELRNDQGFLFLVEADKRGVRKVELVPTLISQMQVNRARGDERRQIIGKMRWLSEELGTAIQETEAGVFVDIRQ